MKEKYPWLFQVFNIGPSWERGELYYWKQVYTILFL